MINKFYFLLNKLYLSKKKVELGGIPDWICFKCLPARTYPPPYKAQSLVTASKNRKWQTDFSWSLQPTLASLALPALLAGVSCLATRLCSWVGYSLFAFELGYPWVYMEATSGPILLPRCEDWLATNLFAFNRSTVRVASQVYWKTGPQCSVPRPKFSHRHKWRPVYSISFHLAWPWFLRHFKTLVSRFLAYNTYVIHTYIHLPLKKQKLKCEEAEEVSAQTQRQQATGIRGQGFKITMINMLRALMEESRQTKTDGLPKPREPKQEPGRNIRN